MRFWWRSTLIALVLLCEAHVLARPNQSDDEELIVDTNGQVSEMPRDNTEQSPKPPTRTLTPPENMEGNTSGDTATLLRSVTLQNPPGVFIPPFYVPLSYTCLPSDVVVMEVLIDTDVAQNVRIFSRTRLCTVADSRLIYVQLDLPGSVMYRPDALNRRTLNIHDAVISLWVVNELDFHMAKTLREARQYALVAEEYPLEFKQPFDRPRRITFQKSRACISWGVEMLLHVNIDSSLQCHPEIGALQLAYFPIPLSADRRGVSRTLGEFKDPYQRRHSRQNKNHPRYTVTMLVFLKSYCRYHLCSIYHRMAVASVEYITPLVFLTVEGKIHFQIRQQDGTYMSMINHFILPKNEWFRLSLNLNGRYWTLTIQCRNFTTKHITGTTAPFPEPIHYFDAEGQTHIGGSRAVIGINGYIADMKLWREQQIKADELPVPDSTHPTRWLNFENYYTECSNLHTKLEWAYKSYMEVIKKYQRRVTCPSFEEYAYSFRHPPNFCTAKVKVSVPRHLRFVYQMLRRVVIVTHHFHTQAWPVLGSMLMAKAEQTLKSHGLDRYDDLIHLLHQASCFQNHEASAMLGAMYTAGLKGRKDQKKGLMYTMIAAQEGNMMAKASLGFQHQYGIGGLNQDFGYAYYYLIEVAEAAVANKEAHGSTAVTTELVRLTDTAQLQYHSGEKGDYFQWMKFQASKGMTDAQTNIARMLFWGQMGVNRDIGAAVEMYRHNALQNPNNAVAQYDYGVLLMRARMGRILYWGSGGVKRNLQAATKYYERTAKSSPENAEALYDYGVVLLRGQGTDKNMTLALEQLQKAADLGHAAAFTAIGWYKMNNENDYVAAAEYFEKGDKMGHRDAAHNLGYMHSRGLYPGREIDKRQAFHYYKRAAEGGHMDAGAAVARMYHSGHESMEPDPELAAKWAYKVGILHQDFGMFLRKGLEAFLSTSWDVSVLYYLMAAEAGLEVAQFNLAYLCEENYEGVADRYFQRGCQWKYYEMASLSPNPHSSTLLKMGEYYWYGHGEKNDTELAIRYYVSAAQHRLPEAIFNLAYISELGVVIPQQYLGMVGVKKTIYQEGDKEEIAKDLYRICRDHNSGEAYIPCGLALLRLSLAQIYRNHPYACQLSSCAIAAALIGLVVAIVTSYYARQRKEEERQQATSLYHALHNGNMNPTNNTNGNNEGSPPNPSHEGPKPPPKRRMAMSSVTDTNETRQVDDRIDPNDVNGGCSGSMATGGSSGMGEVRPISASMVLDSDDPYIQANAARLPEALLIGEATDLHLRALNGLGEGEEERPVEEATV